MGLFNNFAAFFKDFTPGNVSFLGSSFSGGTGRSFTGKVVTQSMALKISAVYACVRNLSEDVAKLKPSVWAIEKVPYGNGEKRVLARKHPLQQLLVKPNSFQDRFQFFETMMCALTLRGNAYVMVLTDERNRPTALIPIHPDRVTLLEAPGGEIFYKVSSSGAFERAQLGGSYFTVPASSMVHLRGLSCDGLVGLSPLQVAANVFTLASTAEEQQEGLFDRGARPGGVLRHPAKISKEAAQRISDNWISVNGGASNAGKTVLLEEGMEWQPLGMTSVDAEFLATRRFEVEEIARFFRMPLHMIGELARSTNNNIAHQGLEYYNNTLSGYLERIEAAFDAFFELSPNYSFEFDTMALMRMDFASAVTTLSQARQGGIMSRNEAREVLKLNPTEDGDKIQDPLNLGIKPSLPGQPDNKNPPPEPPQPQGGGQNA